MRHPRFGLAVVLGLVSWFAPAVGVRAQVVGGVGSDPFSFYYGYYLPHQAYVAAQPTPMDTINANTMLRQQSAATDRATLYDPISAYGEDKELLDPFSQRGRERLAKINGAASNIRGTGPATHYNRTGQYFPGLKTGRGPNRNISTPRYSRFGSPGGFGGGVPSMPINPSIPGMPGPR